jgi:hypothetical protein
LSLSAILNSGSKPSSLGSDKGYRNNAQPEDVRSVDPHILDPERRLETMLLE